ncbi:MAG: sulfatase [Saprospiraceae bacterium]
MKQLIVLFSIALIMSCTATSTTSTSKKTAKTEKPNILFIHVDDLGYHDLSFTGSKIYQTPNIDALAKSGLTFENAYSSYPRCTPSRYGLMTGTYPVNEDHGYLAGISDEQNFVKILKNAGYETHYNGKWHLGAEESLPTGFGFDYSYAASGTGGAGSHFHPFNKEKKNKPKGHEKDPIPNVQEDGQSGDYLTDVMTNATIDYIKNREDKSKPFFAMLSFYAVHTPIEAKNEDKKRNQKEIKAYDFGNIPEEIEEGAGQRKMRQNNANYAGMVENMDENVGRLLATLKEMGIDDNTLIVFSSDHGGLSNRGHKGKRELATTNAPLRAGKGWLYEGGIRVPLIMRWSNEIKPKVDDKNIILGMDVFPTLIDLVSDKKVAGIDGKSYIPVMNGQESWEDRTVFWHSRKARPHSTGDYKTSAVRSGDYKLVHMYEKDIVELYNLKSDIGESQNLAKKEPAKTAEMMKLLTDWKAEYLVAEKLKRKKPKQ